MGAPRVPQYDDTKDKMMERAFGEAMERQRKAWLDELRRGVYIDSRL
jgi:peptidyl-prolyl cis-trans isomerase SurA